MPEGEGRGREGCDLQADIRRDPAGLNGRDVGTDDLGIGEGVSKVAGTCK